jgi:hypothetical protein
MIFRSSVNREINQITTELLEHPTTGLWRRRQRRQGSSYSLGYGEDRREQKTQSKAEGE